jgi:hypothetical protein
MRSRLSGQRAARPEITGTVCCSNEEPGSETQEKDDTYSSSSSPSSSSGRDTSSSSSSSCFLLRADILVCKTGAGQCVEDEVSVRGHEKTTQSRQFCTSLRGIAQMDSVSRGRREKEERREREKKRESERTGGGRAREGAGRGQAGLPTPMGGATGRLAGWPAWTVFYYIGGDARHLCPQPLGDADSITVGTCTDMVAACVMEVPLG